MIRRRILSSMVVAAIGLNAGCLSSGFSTAMTQTKGFFRPAAKPASEELSPEFYEAQKTFRKNTEKNLLAWARYQEDVGEYAEAMKKYREISIAYPACIEAQMGMARIESATGRISQAEQILTSLAARYPDNVSVRLELGRLYSSQEEWEKNIAVCEEACGIAPHDQSCRYELGVALARAGRLQAAMPHLTFAVGAPAAHYNLAYILHETGNDAEAASWLHHALSMHPDPKTAEKSRRLLASLPKELVPEAVHGRLADQRSGESGRSKESPEAINRPQSARSPVRQASDTRSQGAGDDVQAASKSGRVEKADYRTSNNSARDAVAAADYIQEQSQTSSQLVPKPFPASAGSVVSRKNQSNSAEADREAVDPPVWRATNRQGQR